MVQVGRGPLRVCYVGSDEEVADWIRAGFERVEPEVVLVVETAFEDGLERIAEAQQRIDPQMRSPLAETEDPFDCLVCTDDAAYDPVAFVEAVRAKQADLPIVLFAAEGDESLASDAISAGIDDYVTTDEEDPTGTLAEHVVTHCSEYRDAMSERRRGSQAQRLLDANPDVISVVRPGAAITYQNETITEVLGHSVEDLKGTVPYDRIHPDDWRRLREEFYDGVIDKERPPSAEFRIEDADGDWRWVEARGRNLLDDPLVNGFVVTTRAIDDRKRREQDLEGYQRVVENVGDPVYLLDPDERLTWVNRAFLEHTGYEREFVEGTHVSRYMREEDLERGRELVADLLADRDRRWGVFEFATQTIDDDVRCYEANVAVITDDDQFQGTVGVLRDVTERE
ncbi:PAS domain-containing protein [Halorientalis pallida]|uniref:PAS domain S-box protein n=1 Tax=Halorientalis pallida TaxID=2479928 RepID=A0A498L2H5_9EURY|nr:PAS domain S-box protein [Halorientalis pallida]RXK51491.1 PAS domain S-box protein [Halorientalis pallida]